MSNQTSFGPVEYIVVEFPGGTLTSSGFEKVLSLVDAGAIRILDLEFIVKHPGGNLEVIAPGELSIENLDATIFDGACSELLDSDDIAVIGGDIGVGSLAAVLVYEELTLLPAIEAWTAAGGRVVTEGHLDLDELAAVLTDTATEQEK